MRYRALQHQVKNSKDGRFVVELRGERRAWWQRSWRPFVSLLTYKPAWWRRAIDITFETRPIAERAAALAVSRSESAPVSTRAARKAIGL